MTNDRGRTRKAKNKRKKVYYNRGDLRVRKL